MFLKISLKNFMSFKEIDMSFGVSSPLNYALFYGENGAGKTNLIQSVSFLRESTMTLVSGIPNQNKGSQEHGGPTPDLPKICEKARTSGSTENMLTHYEMIVNGGKAEYEMEFAGNTLVHEVLKVKLKRKIGVLFQIDRAGGKIKQYFGKGFITDPALEAEISDRIDRLWGKHSLLAVLNREYMDSNPGYLDERIRKAKEIIDYIAGIGIYVKPVTCGSADPQYSFPDDLEHGMAEEKDLKKLDAYGEALKRFFRRIYHNVMDVYYRKTPVGNGYAYDLIFRRKLYGGTVDIPSVQESSGTRKLVEMFRTLVGCASGHVAFIDEIDSGIHDKLIQDLLPQVLQDIGGQLVITTHNTGLLRKVSPNNVFVIDIDAEGFKKISKFSSMIKTMANNNNQNRYMNNAVGGVPFIGTVDLGSIAEKLQSDLAGQ